MFDNKISPVIETKTAEFYIADEEPQNGNLAPEGHSHTSVTIILQTKNADKLYAQPITAGATEICSMTTEEDWRIGKLKEPFGNRLHLVKKRSLNFEKLNDL